MNATTSSLHKVAHMHIVSKDLTSDSDALSPEAKAALIGAYTAKATPEQNALATTLLSEIRGRDKWISCDCAGTGTNKPLLAPVRLQNGYTFYLRRLTGHSRTHHDKDCPFFHDPDKESILSGQGSGLRPLKGTADSDFALLSAFTDDDALAADSQLSLTKEMATYTWPVLQRFMAHLLARAGLNKVIPVQEKLQTAVEPPSINGQKKAIAAVTSGIFLGPNIPLADVLALDPKPVSNGNLSKRISQEGRVWPEGKRPQGYLLAPAKTASANRAEFLIGDDPNDLEKIYVEKSTTTARGLIKDQAVPPNGPFLVLYVCGQLEPKNPVIVPIRGHAHPIYSYDAWIPVEGGSDRRMLEILIGVQHYAAHALPDVWMTITKPLSDLSHDGALFRPDYIIKAWHKPTDSTRIIYIDVMGIHVEDYDTAKEITQAHARRAAPLLVIHRDRVNAIQVPTREDPVPNQAFLDFVNEVLTALTHPTLDLLAALEKTINPFETTRVG